MVFGFHHKELHVAKTIIVTLDFDGTIANRQHLKIEYAEKLFGIKITEKEGKETTFPLGAEKYKYMLNIIERNTMDYELASHCHEVLTNLYAQGFRFALVTSRMKENLQAAIKFIKHYNLPVSYFHSTNELPKDYICNKLHARAMVDDTFSKLEAMRDTFVSLYFFRHPWNNHEIPSFPPHDIRIVNSWIEFYNELMELKVLHEAICYLNNWENNFLNVAKIAEFAKRYHAESPKLIEEYRKKKTLMHM